MQAILLFSFFKTISSGFAGGDEAFPGSQAWPFDLNPGCCYDTKTWSGAFCPVEDGSQEIGLYTEWSTSGSIIKPSTSYASITIDGTPHSGSGSRDHWINLGTYNLKKGKCYPIYAKSYAGDGTSVKSRWYSKKNGYYRYGNSNDFCNYNSEECVITSKGSAKRITSTCQVYTEVYCNGGDPIGGISVTLGKEKCKCDSNSGVDIFCEKNNYKPFGDNSLKLNMKVEAGLSDSTTIVESIDSNSLISVPYEPYSTITYSGYVYLPQKGDYHFSCVSRLPAIIQIGDSSYNFDTLYANHFLGCSPDNTQQQRWNEVKYSSSKARNVVSIKVTVYTQCSIINDHDVQIQWIYKRKQYYKSNFDDGLTYVWENLPSRYLSDKTETPADP